MYDISGLGARIRQLRIIKGYTQDTFAKELGVSPQAVSKWETGAGCPDISMLPLIASILGVTIDALFSDIDPAEVMPPLPVYGEPAVDTYPAPPTPDVYPTPPVPPTPPIPPTPPVPDPESTAGEKEEHGGGGVRLVHRFLRLECLSDLEVVSTEGPVVRFSDGSNADLSTRVIINYGKGIIKLREIPASERYYHEGGFPQIEDFISRQVEAALAGNEEALNALGDALTDHVQEALKKNAQFFKGTLPSEISGIGKNEEQSWEGTDIRSLDVTAAGYIDVRIHEGNDGKWRVVAKGDHEYLSNLRVTEDGDLLKIDCLPFKPNFGWGRFNRKLTVDIYAGFELGEYLDARVRGSGAITCEPSFETSSVSVSGSGDIELVNAGNLTCGVSGSGDIKFKTAKNAKITVSGSGDITAESLDGVNEFRISGSGDGKIEKVAGNLTCGISGSGDISIGNVSLTGLSVSVSGGGDMSVGTGSIDNLMLSLHGAGKFKGSDVVVGEVEANLNGASEAVIGRVLGKSIERISRPSTFRILKRGNE